MARKISNFPPIVGEQPRILILGTMPGEDSLRTGQYYARTNNTFWPLMADIFDIPPFETGNYVQRCEALMSAGIAVWDVYQHAERENDGKPSSSDSDIRNAEFADIGGFLEKHPTIRKIILTSGKVEKAFTKYKKQYPHIKFEQKIVRLPSTSPANTHMTFEEKKLQWRTEIL